jgi:hypothetical protein
MLLNLKNTRKKIILFSILLILKVLQCDFSMCLAKLLNYPEPDDTRAILESAVAVEKRLSGDQEEIVNSNNPSREPSPIKVSSNEKMHPPSSKEPSPYVKAHDVANPKENPNAGSNPTGPKFFSTVNNMVESLSKFNPFGSLLNDSPPSNPVSKNPNRVSQEESPVTQKTSNFEEISIGVSIRMGELLPDLRNYVSNMNE